MSPKGACLIAGTVMHGAQHAEARAEFERLCSRQAEAHLRDFIRLRSATPSERSIAPYQPVGGLVHALGLATPVAFSSGGGASVGSHLGGVLGAEASHERQMSAAGTSYMSGLGIRRASRVAPGHRTSGLFSGISSPWSSSDGDQRSSNDGLNGGADGETIGGASGGGCSEEMMGTDRMGVAGGGMSPETAADRQCIRWGGGMSPETAADRQCILQGGEIETCEPSFKQDILPPSMTPAAARAPSTYRGHRPHDASSFDPARSTTPTSQAISWRQAADRAISETGQPTEGDHDALLSPEVAAWGWGTDGPVTASFYEGLSPNQPQQLSFTPIEGSTSSILELEALIEHQTRLLHAYEQHLRAMETGRGPPPSQASPQRRHSVHHQQPASPWQPSRFQSASLSGVAGGSAGRSTGTDGWTNEVLSAEQVSGRRRSLARYA